MEIKLKPLVERDSIQASDLNVNLSGAFVIRSRMGSLVNLREELKRLFNSNQIFHTFSSQALYVVHWNDLSPQKQKELSQRKGDGLL